MKIAVIGGGISGLGAAYLLRSRHDVVLYEKNSYLGGHSRTVKISTPDNDSVHVDTGFIVFNHRNYPHLTRLFNHLAVPVHKSNMSFGVSIDDGWLEYGTRHLTYLFSQKRNLFRSQFWGMLSDIIKFNKSALRYIEEYPDVSLGQLLEHIGVSSWFRDYYLLPMGASIWSTPLRGMLEFPARTFITFFDNHGLLTVKDQPQWYTVKGGSKEYVKRISAPLTQQIKLNTTIKKIERSADAVLVYENNGDISYYDQLIFACHPDQALRLLANPTDDEKRIIGSFTYQPNTMFLHSDTNFMPHNQKAWSSWVYLSNRSENDHNQRSVSLSYWMNNLQPLQTSSPIIVTLNPTRAPAQELTHDKCTFEHPVFDQKAIDAQKLIPTIQGNERIWYCGAWQRYGFHEDGLLSAVTVAKYFNIEVPW